MDRGNDNRVRAPHPSDVSLVRAEEKDVDDVPGLTDQRQWLGRGQRHARSVRARHDDRGRRRRSGQESQRDRTVVRNRGRVRGGRVGRIRCGCRRGCRCRRGSGCTGRNDCWRRGRSWDQCRTGRGTWSYGGDLRDRAWRRRRRIDRSHRLRRIWEIKE